jgi:hypothetical protein
VRTHTVLARATYCDYHALAGEGVTATYDVWTRESGGAYVCDSCYTVAGEPALGVHATRLIVEGAGNE